MQWMYLAIDRKVSMLMILMSMPRLLFVYFSLMDPATRAVNVYILTHSMLRDPSANSSSPCRYCFECDFMMTLSFL